MPFLRGFLLTAFIFYFSMPLVASQYLLKELPPNGAMGKSGDRLSKAVYLFSTDLHKTIIKSSFNDNIFFSPISIYVALAMLYAGSGGKTKSQLASALHLNVFKDDSELYQSLKILLQTLESTKKNYTLKMANRLFAQKGFKISDDYTRKTDEYFRAKLEELDFAKDPPGSRVKINKWVETMTSNKIKDLFPKSAVTSSTVLALANAVYFNGSWLYKFDKKSTKPETFSVSEKERIQVPMMNLMQSKGLRYSTLPVLALKILELPYSDAGLSMIIALDEGNGDFSLLMNGTSVNMSWKEKVQVFTDVPVRLSLPKFIIHRTMNLKKSLDALGLSNLFGPAANLSGITDSSSSLALSEAIHKAYIAVDEEGTVASAATGIGINTKSMPSPMKDIIYFIVDKPFTFVVVEKTTGCILFFGHIKNPLKASN